MRPIFPLGGLWRGSALLTILVACFVAFCQGARQLSIGAIFTDKMTTSFFGFRRGAILHNVVNNGTDSVQFVGFEKYVTEANSFELGQKVCDLFTNGILLIGADIEPPLISTALSYSGTFHIPIIITSLSKRDMGLNTTGTRDYLVSMMPSLVPVMVDLIKFHQWKRFAYIYDGDKGLLRLHALMERLSLRRIDVAFRKINNRTSMIQTLREFRDTKRQQIICDTSYKNTNLLMEQIPLLGMVTASYHYIFMDLDIDKINMEKFQYGGMNVTGFNILNETSLNFILMKRAWDYIKKQNTSSISRKQMFLSHRSALMMDLVDVMDKTVKILKLEKKLDQFDNRGQRSCDDDPFRPWEFDKNVLRFLKRVSFTGATGPISFNNYGERSNYAVNILSLFYDGMKKIGTWDAKASTPLKFDNGAYNNGSGVSKNKTYLVTSVIEPPYLMLKEPRHLYFGNNRYQGYAIDLLEEIVKKTSFKYKIKLVHDKAYGIPVNGTWNGMVGELVDGKADLAVAPLTITSDRERVIDFTKPFMSLGISIMIKKPQTTKPDVFSFMHPLSYEIWMCIVLAYAGVSVVLFLVSRFSPKEWYPIEYTRVPTDDQPNGACQLNDKTTNDFGITNSLWFSFGALMQQGCDISPRSLSGRIVGGVWWFFTLIIISSYTANLAAFLTVERMVTNIKSAQDLVQSKDVSYGMLSEGSTLEFFKQSKIPLYKDMWTYMNTSERSVMMTSNEQGVERVRHMNGKFAFLIESTINEYFSQQKPCDTMKVGQNLDSKSYGIGISRNLTQFSDDLTLAILQLREEGVLDALQKRWWFDKGECHEANSDASSNALSLSNVAGVFYILVGGLSMALFSAIIEFYWKSRSQSRKQKTSLAAAMRAKVRLSVTGENADLASQLHPKGSASAPNTETETTPVDKSKDSSPEGNHTEV